MFTVIVGLVGSGNSSTLRPFGMRYSVIPSTETTFCARAAGAAAGRAGLVAEGAPAPGFAGASAEGRGGASAGGFAAWGRAGRLAGKTTLASRRSALAFRERIESPPKVWGFRLTSS